MTITPMKTTRALIGGNGRIQQNNFLLIFELPFAKQHRLRPVKEDTLLKKKPFLPQMFTQYLESGYSK